MESGHITAEVNYRLHNSSAANKIKRTRNHILQRSNEIERQCNGPIPLSLEKKGNVKKPNRLQPNGFNKGKRLKVI